MHVDGAEVVATRWRAGDRQAMGLVRELYDALARGLPVAAALRAAKLAALRRGEPPRTWAAFIVVAGDPLVRVPLRPPEPPAPGWAVAVVLIVGGIAWWSSLVHRRLACPSESPVLLDDGYW